MYLGLLRLQQLLQLSAQRSRVCLRDQLLHIHSRLLAAMIRRSERANQRLQVAHNGDLIARGDRV